MPKPKLMPPAEYLRECFEYSPNTGQLTWKQVKQLKRRPQFVGEPAGVPVGKYLKVGLDGEVYAVHRIIWKWMTGEDPPSDIDHKDRNSLNNRWSNLRLATKAEAVWNRRLPPRIVNHHLPHGVAPSGKRRWRAMIKISGVTRHLGTFSTTAEAAAAYEATARQLRKDFYNPS